MLNMLAMSTRVPVLMRARDKIGLCYHDSCLLVDPGTTTAAFYLRSLLLFLPFFFLFLLSSPPPLLELLLLSSWSSLLLLLSSSLLLLLLLLLSSPMLDSVESCTHLPRRGIILSDRARHRKLSSRCTLPLMQETRLFFPVERKMRLLSNSAKIFFSSFFFFDPPSLHNYHNVHDTRFVDEY